MSAETFTECWPRVPDHDATVDDILHWAACRALVIEGGNKPNAAKRLGISLKTLYNWLNKWDDRP